MKKTITAAILCLGCYLLQAQDLIYTKREGVLKAKVTEITHSLIRFKKAENIDGPNYTIANRYVDSIRYENGTRELFGFNGKRLPDKYLKELEAFSALPNNQVSTGFDLSAYNLPGFLSFNNVDETPFAGWFIAYERLLFKQKIGISISPFASWNRRYYGVSAAAQLYAKNKGRMRFGLGPIFNYSVQNKAFSYRSPENNGSYMLMTTKTHVTSLAMNLSIVRNLNRKVFVDCDIIAGGKLAEKPFKNNLPEQWSTNIKRKDGPVIGFRLGAGYRF